MKRKLDSNNVPSIGKSIDKRPINESFEDLKLDPRLLHAILKENYLKPTPVQATAIPLVLDGRDILGV